MNPEDVRPDLDKTLAIAVEDRDLTGDVEAASHLLPALAAALPCCTPDTTLLVRGTPSIANTTRPPSMSRNQASASS